MFRRREQQQTLSHACAPGAGPGGQCRAVNSQAAEAAAIQIQAQPLGSALKQLGQQTSLQLFFSPELVAGKQAPAVSGNLAPEQALQQLLQGSGLTFEMSGRHRGGKASADTLDLGSGSLELAPTDIKVVGDWLGDAQQSVVQNHPGARTVVRREAMVEKGAMNVRDVLRGIPGVQVQDSNGTGGSDLSLNVGVRPDFAPVAALHRADRRHPGRLRALWPAAAVDGADFLGQPRQHRRGAWCRLGALWPAERRRGDQLRHPGDPRKGLGELSTTLETSRYGGWKHTESAFVGGTADNGMGVALLYTGVNGNGYRESNNGNDIDDVLLKTHWAPTDVDEFWLNFHYYDGRADMPGGLTQAQYDSNPYQSLRDYDYFAGRRKDVSFKWQRQLDDATQFEVLTYYTDSFRGSAIASRDMKTLSSYPRNYHTFAIEPRVSRVFFVGPTTQEVSVGYRYLKEAMREQSTAWR
jgi:Fe(3+) dicitrate transport protein